MQYKPLDIIIHVTETYSKFLSRDIQYVHTFTSSSLVSDESLTIAFLELSISVTNAFLLPSQKVSNYIALKLRQNEKKNLNLHRIERQLLETCILRAW